MADKYILESNKMSIFHMFEGLTVQSLWTSSNFREIFLAKLVLTTKLVFEFLEKRKELY